MASGGMPKPKALAWVLQGRSCMAALRLVGWHAQAEGAGMGPSGTVAHGGATLQAVRQL